MKGYQLRVTFRELNKHGAGLEQGYLTRKCKPIDTQVINGFYENVYDANILITMLEEHIKSYKKSSKPTRWVESRMEKAYNSIAVAINSIRAEEFSI